MGELSSEELPLSLEKIGLKLGRFKTGTPARIDGRTNRLFCSRRATWRHKPSFKIFQ